MMSDFNNTSVVNTSYPGKITGPPAYNTAPQVAICILQAFFILTAVLPSLICFAKYSSLRTPFNCYLVSVLCADIDLALYIILVAVQTHYRQWIFNDNRFCTFYLFLAYYGMSVMANSQLLISVNRIWALFFPHHYRTHHTVKVALTLCASNWLLTLALIAPFVTINERYRTDPTKFCTVDFAKQPIYTLLVSAFFYIPMFVIILTFPILLVKQRVRLKIRAEKATNGNPMGEVTFGGREMPTAHADCDQRRASRVGIRPVGFLILTWVVICAIIFWGPNTTFQLLRFVVPNAKFRDPVTATWILNWSFFSYCLEPWVFIFTVPLLRAKIRGLVGSASWH